MSEFTQCNFCRLQRIQKRAKAKNEKVEVSKNRKHGGVDVVVDGQKIAWFMALTDRCMC